MARIGFYAPLKSPNHPTPSGDRQIARLLMRALEDGGAHQVTLVSELRGYDGKGSQDVQSQILDAARDECARLSAAPAFDLWVSYHNYYKAPDLLGPVISAAQGIPYVLFEATRARKRLSGPWAQFAKAAEAANDAADLIFHFTARDGIALREQGHARQIIAPLPPFLGADTLPAPTLPAHEHAKTILSVGMMRGPDKYASYVRITEILVGLKINDWKLVLVGDGPRRAEVEALFAPFGARVTFAGQLDQEALAQAYRQASVFLWPGINEAFGMVYLEAQAAGLPALAEDRPGVRDVLPKEARYAMDTPASLAARLDTLLSDAKARRHAALQAHGFVLQNHLFSAARAQIFASIDPLLKGS